MVQPRAFSAVALALVSLPLLAAGCDPAGASTETAIRFAARVGGQAFDCGSTYSQMGTTASTWAPADFRFYVHDVVLFDAGGAEVPVEGIDGPWQRAGVTLLDFENKTGGCDKGTTETNEVVAVRAPAGSYTGLRFKVGVPFAQNHQDVSTAMAPLNVSGMFWNWQGGYKFIKVDGQTTGMPTGYNIHIGSTACDGDAMGHVTACQNPNRMEITLTGFDPTQRAVVADLAALVATSDVNTNTMGSAPGCMSVPTDPECAPLFARLGLPFGAAATQAQSFFTAP